MPRVRVACAIEQEEKTVKKCRQLSVLLGVIAVTSALVGGGLVVLAQEQATTGTEATKSKTKPRVKHRAKKTAAADTEAGETAEKPAAMPQKRGRCDPMQQEQTDLSGTYSGRVNYPDGDMTGEGTLTITGNTFTLTSGDKTQTGRITAESTCHYISVAMMFGDVSAPKPGETAGPPPPTISLRAHKAGDRLSLMTVPGETHRFSFGSAGGGTAHVRRHKAGKPKAAAAATPTP
jgi:hypothetical protein